MEYFWAGNNAHATQAIPSCWALALCTSPAALVSFHYSIPPDCHLSPFGARIPLSPRSPPFDVDCCCMWASCTVIYHAPPRPARCPRTHFLLCGSLTTRRGGIGKACATCFPALSVKPCTPSQCPGRAGVSAEGVAFLSLALDWLTTDRLTFRSLLSCNPITTWSHSPSSANILLLIGREPLTSSCVLSRQLFVSVTVWELLQ